MSVFSYASKRAAVAMTTMAVAAALVASQVVKNAPDDQFTRHQRLQLASQRNLLTRRYFPSGISCNLFMKDVEFGPTSDNPEGYSADEWFCELSEEDSIRLGIDHPSFLDIADSESVVPSGSLPGQSILFATEATIDIAQRTLFIPQQADVTVERRKGSRKLTQTTGVLNALVIRITDSKGVAPVADLNQLKNDIFKDSASLKTQFEACSYGKLTVRPYSGTTETNIQINNGLVDLVADYDVYGANGGSRTELQQAAIVAAENSLGNLRNQFDVIMFCMPPGTGNWLAYAFVNDQFSFYNNEWCSYVSGQLHEVGHNLGLAHSGEGSGLGVESYLDQQGLMGISYGRDDLHMCYNPAKSYQLGWYDDKVLTVNPLSRDETYGIPFAGREFTMNGVSDYEKNDSALIVLRLEQVSSEKDFYIGYNRKDGINADTFEDGDKITIVRKEEGLPDEFGASTKVASLEPGESHVIRNFDGQNHRVKITFIGLRDGNATIKISDPSVRIVASNSKNPNTKSTKNAKSAKNGNTESKNQFGQCAPHRVELMTDSRPADYKWFVLEDEGIGTVHATSPVYSEGETLYTSNFCLPYGTTYNFVIKYGDRDGPSGGYFRGYDQLDNLVFSKDFQNESVSNGIDVKSFLAVKNPSKNLFDDSKRNSVKMTSLETSPRSEVNRKTPRGSRRKPQMKPEKRRRRKQNRRKRNRRRKVPKDSASKKTGRSRSSTTDSCKDIKQHPITWSKQHRKLNCRQISERDKCDTIWFKTNEPLWHVCQKSCEKCNEIITSKDDPNFADGAIVQFAAQLNTASTKELIGTEQFSRPITKELINTETDSGLVQQDLSPQDCKDITDGPIPWSPVEDKFTCQQIGEMEMCDFLWLKRNIPLWIVCRRSCNKCDEFPDELLFV